VIGVANMTEAEARKAAEAAGYRLEKRGRTYRLVVAATGTLAAGDWTQPDEDYFGLSLDQIAEALEP
jgi:hypothetical protein